MERSTWQETEVFTQELCEGAIIQPPVKLPFSLSLSASPIHVAWTLIRACRLGAEPMRAGALPCFQAGVGGPPVQSPPIQRPRDSRRVLTVQGLSADPCQLSG